MATTITDECINCGACEPECPNVAIFQGGVEYQLNGSVQAPLSNDFFFIVADKCTECVGFFDQEACAAVCPVDCCVPNPEIPEAEAALLDRAKALHPDKSFADDFPSRFRGEGQASAPAPGNDAAPAPAPAPAVAAAPAPTQGAAPVAVAEPVAAAIDDFEVPILCRSCQGEYEVGYRFIIPGTVLRCPYCGGSFSPTQQMFSLVSEHLEAYAQEVNAAVDRYTEVVEREDKRLRKIARSVQQRVQGELRDITTPLTERPKRSVFG